MLSQRLIFLLQGTSIFKNLPAAWSVLQISFCHKNSIYPLLLLTMLPCTRHLYIFLLLHMSVGQKENKHLSTVNIPEVSNAPLPASKEKKVSSFYHYSLSVLQRPIFEMTYVEYLFIFYKNSWGHHLLCGLMAFYINPPNQGILTESKKNACFWGTGKGVSYYQKTITPCYSCFSSSPQPLGSPDHS